MLTCLVNLVHPTNIVLTQQKSSMEFQQANFPNNEILVEWSKLKLSTKWILFSQFCRMTEIQWVQIKILLYFLFLTLNILLQNNNNWNQFYSIEILWLFTIKMHNIYFQIEIIWIYSNNSQSLHNIIIIIMLPSHLDRLF